MPSVSGKQHRFMEAVAHSPAFAKKVGVPQSVGQEFSKADKGRKFSKGGEIMATKKAVGKGPMEREGMTTAKMGKVKAGGIKKFGEHAVQTKGHTRGKNVGDSGKTVGIQRGATGMKRGGKC